ncbi:hypothetical protein GOP47_0005737 [Adiantum capillus-veneris]|uniref:Uncharacterized protein n=1 Tax=Adiantum capillus-veneris TaxID=13818 RepID=A0A9D4ZLN7_ADICA|nr:hypothetical protein GOP47_0005737 [Adiantum capillus-veneris]
MHFEVAPIHDINMPRFIHPEEEVRHACCVPFAWEEKPGVPKMQPLQRNSTLLVISGIPASAPTLAQAAHSAVVSFTLCKPPRLQQHESTSQRSIGKTASFNCPHISSKRFVRRSPSFDHILHGGPTTCRNPRAESFKYHNIKQLGQHGRAYRLEDDPFFMAIQACRKEQLFKAVYYNHDNESKREYSELEESRFIVDRRVRGAATAGRHNSHALAEDSKHGQTFKLQANLREEADDLHKAQMQEEQASRLFTRIASCVGLFHYEWQSV